MVLIVGLGNPGEEFKGTRHNLGFEVLDQFARENKFPGFKFSKKFNAEISQKGNVILAKPQTFMNNSGKAVKILNTKYKIQDTSNLWVIHDDLDLPLGKLKISKGRGSAGHKGVQSIIDELGTKDFIRFRLGINRTHGLVHRNTKEFVLEKFSKEEKKIIKKGVKDAVSKMKERLTETE